MKTITPKRYFSRAPRKPHVQPGKPSPLLKLKHLPMEQREELYRLTESLTCAQWRDHVEKTYGVKLRSDGNVTAFRDWHWNTVLLERRNAKIEAFDEHIRKFAPGREEAEYRAAVLAFVTRACAADEDWKGAVAAVRASTEAERVVQQRAEFEFDAARACIAHLPKLRDIVRDPTLNETQKIEAARLALFGVAPK